MLDRRIGLAIAAKIDDKLIEICSRHGGENKPLSKGDFLSAMITMLPPEVMDKAIEAYKQDRDSRKQAQKQQKKDLQRAIKNLSPEQIAKLLAEADKT
jgi:adenosylmethionine-8-amino-7-oxononanoate aminotransferase